MKSNITPTRRRLWRFALSVGGLVSLAGCQCGANLWDSCCMSIRDRWESQLAWEECEEMYDGCQDHIGAFGDGFKDGYRAAGNGGDGCSPLIPPRKFWSTGYQNDSGRADIVAWFDGYQHGAAVATSDGVAGRNQLITSRDIYHKPETKVDLPDFKRKKTMELPRNGVPPEGEAGQFELPADGAVDDQLNGVDQPQRPQTGNGTFRNPKRQQRLIPAPPPDEGLDTAFPADSRPLGRKSSRRPKSNPIELTGGQSSGDRGSVTQADYGTPPPSSMPRRLF